MTDEREARIRALLPLVRRVARRIRRLVPTSDLDDLVGDGAVGLIRAVDAWDPARGIPLEQYARHVVAGAMLNGLRRLDPVSERTRRAVRRGETVRYALAQQLGTLPPASAVEAASPGFARARADAHRGTPLSLDAQLPPGERLTPDASGDPQRLCAALADREALRACVAALPPRQRAVVEAHYYGARSLRTLGGELGISPQRVSQLHLAALARLRVTVAAP